MLVVLVDLLQHHSDVVDGPLHLLSSLFNGIDNALELGQARIGGDLSIGKTTLPLVVVLLEAALPLVVVLLEACVLTSILLVATLLQLVEEELGIRIHGAQGTLEAGEVQVRRDVIQNGNSPKIDS